MLAGFGLRINLQARIWRTRPWISEDAEPHQNILNRHQKILKHA